MCRHLSDCSGSSCNRSWKARSEFSYTAETHSGLCSAPWLVPRTLFLQCWGFSWPQWWWENRHSLDTVGIVLVPIKGKQEKSRFRVRIRHLEIVPGHIIWCETQSRRHIRCFEFCALIQRSELPVLVQCRLLAWSSSWRLVKLGCFTSASVLQSPKESLGQYLGGQEGPLPPSW